MRRLFVAIWPPDDARAELASAVDLLRTRIERQGVKFVHPDRMHVTLRFLGKVEESRIPSLAADLATACFELAPRALRCTGLGCYPTAFRPAVIWSALDGEMDDLVRAVRGATDAYAEKPEEREFSPHLTLARVSPASQAVGRATRPLIEASNRVVWGGWVAGDAALVESVPGRQYEILCRFPFEGES